MKDKLGQQLRSLSSKRDMLGAELRSLSSRALDHGKMVAEKAKKGASSVMASKACKGQ